jgi:translation initiation factor IF-2
MTDTKTPGDKTISVTSPKTLSIKRPMEQSTVRQSFSHGRSKAVVVEVKRRIVGPGSTAPLAAEVKEPVARVVSPAPPPVVVRPPAAPAAPRPANSMVLRTLSDDEKDARTRALSDARIREAGEREQALADAAQRSEREEREKREREAAQARQREEEERKRHEDDQKRRGHDEARRRLGEVVPPAPPRPPRPVEAVAPLRQLRDSGARPPRLDGPRPASTSTRTPRPVTDATAAPVVVPPPAANAPRRVTAAIDRTVMDDDGPKGAKRGGAAMKPGAAVKTPKPGDPKQRGRLTLSNALASGEERTHSIAAFRRRMQRMSGQRDDSAKEKIAREVTIPETITIQELANRMAERGVDVVRLLMKQGQMLKITDMIDADTAQLIAEEMGHSVKRVSEADVEEGLFDVPGADGDLVARPAVVTIMGHVDHGKTSLLDAIRKTAVVSGEAGGITQHIGAYQVTTPSGALVTFIDTPGHAAFTAMRARGAKVTDVVVLVVAADDGVMPQTIEAINHAKAAKVPLIIAINKIDKPDAKPERVRSELLQYEVQVESLGGDTLELEVSAKTGTGLDKLLDAIALQAEILDLKADPNRAAEGTIIEAKLDRGRGPVATALIQRGTIHPGEIVVAGAEWGRVRVLVDDTGKTVKEAGPSMPVEVLGFSGAPEAGDRIAVVESEARAREITSYRQRQKRDKQAARMATVGRSLTDMMRDLKAGSGKKEFPLVIKGDVQGSVEAIIGALEKAGNEEVQARVLLSGVGGITESDVTLAQASGAIVIGFNVRAHKEAREAAQQSGTEIRYYNIIYDLVDDVKAAMSGLLAPTLRETMLGTALMLEIFNISKFGKIAGSRVTDGKIERGANVRLIRDDVVIHEGRLSTLKRFKDDVKEVISGQECGVSFENYQDMRAGDVVECYRVESIKRSL